MVQLPAENSILAAAVRRAADEHRLSHAVILTGRGDLTAAARFLAAAHVCEGEHKPCLTCRHCRKALEGVHPDVISVQDTEHKELTVEAVRALRKDVYIRPNEAERKVYIIADCRQLNERDQNVLLKIVEEGPSYAAFIFCADSPAALLETIRSRRGKPRPEPSCAEEARRLADRLTDRQLTGLESVLRQYAGECDYNVGVGHVLGGLAAKWEELL